MARKQRNRPTSRLTARRSGFGVLGISWYPKPKRGRKTHYRRFYRGMHLFLMTAHIISRICDSKNAVKSRLFNNCHRYHRYFCYSLLILLSYIFFYFLSLSNITSVVSVVSLKKSSIHKGFHGHRSFIVSVPICGMEQIEQIEHIFGQFSYNISYIYFFSF